MLFAPEAPPRLLAVVDWEMATIGDPLIDLAWALIFHPVGGTMPLGTAGPEHVRARSHPSARGDGGAATRIGRDATSRRSTGTTCSRAWKGAIVLEGSFAKWQRGESDKAVHEWFGPQADLLLESAAALVAGTSGAPA